MHRNLRPSRLRRLFQATPAGVPLQALAIAALVAIPAVILAALPSRQPAPPEPIAVDRQFTLACTRSFEAAPCRCAANGLRAVIGRDAFREAVLRNAGNVFGDREHSETAHRIIDACVASVVPVRDE